MAIGMNQDLIIWRATTNRHVTLGFTVCWVPSVGVEILPSQRDPLALQESGAETTCRVHSRPLSLLLMQPWLSVEWHIHHSLQRKLIGNVLMISHIFTLWPLWNCYKHYVTSNLIATHHVKLSKFIASQNYLTFLIFSFVVHYPQ